MRKICLTLLFLALVTGSAWAGRPVAGDVTVEGGHGWFIDKDGNPGFNFETGVDYHILDMLSAGLFLDAFGAGASGMDIGARGTFHFTSSRIPTNIEPIASFGFGYAHFEGGQNKVVLPIDFGVYWYPQCILNGKLGVGTRMGFNILFVNGSNFVYSWNLASLNYKF